MRVFVTGASGYIGRAVARAFRAKGHTVYGLIRSEEKAGLLSIDEIYPVIGNMDQPETYHHILNEVEVVVHCAFETSEKGIELDAKTIDTILGAFSQTTLPKAFIYTSGVWVYGSTGYKIVDEANALNPIEISKWRPEHEEKVLNATSKYLRTVVMRPGCVYGSVGGLTDIFFKSTLNGSVSIIEDGSNHWSMIHVQDLAYAYVSAAEKELTGVVLNVSDDSHFTIKEMAEAIARVAGVEGQINSISKEEAEKEFGPLAQGLMIDQQVSNARIKRLLHWTIHHEPFVNEIDLYYKAWESSQHSQHAVEF